MTTRTADPTTKLGHVPSTIFISDMDMDNDSVTQNNDNTDTLAPDNDEAVRRMEVQMVELKIDLANAKSAEDCLKLELSKLRVAFEQARQENERLRLQILGQQHQGGEVRQTHVIPTQGAFESESSYYESSKTITIETGKRISTTTNNEEMLYHGLPSCASGIAFLSGNFLSSASLQSLVISGSFDGSVRSARQPNLPRLPSCASAIALLYHSYSSNSISSLISGGMERKYSQLSLKRMAEARENNGEGRTVPVEVASVGGASSVASSTGGMSRGGSKKSSRDEDWDFFTIVEE